MDPCASFTMFWIGDRQVEIDWPYLIASVLCAALCVAYLPTAMRMVRERSVFGPKALVVVVGAAIFSVLSLARALFPW